MAHETKSQARSREPGFSNRLTLRGAGMLVGFFILVLPNVFAGAWLLQSAGLHAERDEMGRLEIVRATAQRSIETRFDESREEVAMLAARLASLPLEAARRDLEIAIAGQTSVIGYDLLDASGASLVRIGEIVLSDEAWRVAPAHAAGARPAQIFLAPVAGADRRPRQMALIAVPSGERILVARIGPAMLVRSLQVAQGLDAEIFLIQRHGELLVGPQGSDDPNFLLDAAHTPWIEAALMGGAWSGRADWSGDAWLVSAGPAWSPSISAASPWTVLARRKAALIDDHRLLKAAYAFGPALAAFALLQMLGVWSLMRWIGTPLRRMGATLRALAAGPAELAYEETRYREAAALSAALRQTQARLSSEASGPQS